MLTKPETFQLVHDIQHSHPALLVTQRTYQPADQHVVIVQDPTSRNEVRITSLRTQWRAQVDAMYGGQ